MNMLEIISRNIFIPISNLKNDSNCNKDLRFLNKSQFFSLEQIRELQWQKVKKIVDYAYNNSVFLLQSF